MNKTNGFTLPELLITLTILGIISLLAMPALSALMERERSRSAVHALYHHLKFARASSVEKNRLVTLCASEDRTSCNGSRDWSSQLILVFIDDNGNGKLDGDDQLLQALDFSQHSGTLHWRSFGNKSYLQWYPHGMTHYQSGNFTYCPANNDARLARRITLNAAGRVYFSADNNNDGIVEGSDGKNIVCGK